MILPKRLICFLFSFAIVVFFLNNWHFLAKLSSTHSINFEGRKRNCRKSLISQTFYLSQYFIGQLNRWPFNCNQLVSTFHPPINSKNCLTKVYTKSQQFMINFTIKKMDNQLSSTWYLITTINLKVNNKINSLIY